RPVSVAPSAPDRIRARGTKRHGTCLPVRGPSGSGLRLSALLGGPRQADVAVDAAVHGAHRSLSPLRGLSGHSASNPTGMDPDVPDRLTNPSRQLPETKDSAPCSHAVSIASTASLAGS